MKNLKLILVIGLVLVGAGAYYGYTEYNRKAEDTADLKVDAKVAAEVLITAYESDENLANTSYLNKVINVNGTVTNVEQDSANVITVYLGNENSITGVSCQLQGEKGYQTTQFAIGTKVDITGVCSGYLSDVVLMRAVLNENK